MVWIYLLVLIESRNSKTKAWRWLSVINEVKSAGFGPFLISFSKERHRENLVEIAANICVTIDFVLPALFGIYYVVICTPYNWNVLKIVSESSGNVVYVPMAILWLSYYFFALFTLGMVVVVLPAYFLLLCIVGKYLLRGVSEKLANIPELR